MSLEAHVDNVAAVLRAQWHFRHATRVGLRVRLYGKAAIKNRGTLVVGDRVRLFSTVATLQLEVGHGAALHIGDRTLINYGSSIGATQLVRIGERCNIGTHCILIDNDFHSLEPERRDEVPPSAPIVLRDNVWLGARVIVLRGVTIGEGSVVAAGSVVTRDVEPRSLVGGVPAKLLRRL